MALIRCPECGKEISDKALVCIGCGAPIEEIPMESVETSVLAKSSVIINKKKRGWYGLTIPLLSFASIMLLVALSLSLNPKRFEYPITALLPLILCAILFSGALLLHISAAKNVAGKNVKKMVIISLILIGLAIILFPITRIVNSSIGDSSTPTNNLASEIKSSTAEANLTYSSTFRVFVEAIEEAGHEVYTVMDESDKDLEKYGEAIDGISIILKDKWGDMGDIVVIFQYKDNDAIEHFWETGSPKYYPESWERHGLFALNTSHEYLLDILTKVKVN